MIFTSYFITDLLALILFVVFLLYLYFTRKFDYWKKRNVCYIKPVPFVGNFLQGLLMKQNMGETFQEMYNESKERFLGIFVLDEPSLMVRDPELIKKILVTDFGHFYDRTTVGNTSVDPLGSNVLFVMKNPDWKNTRKEISPIFTSLKIKLMYHLMQISGEELIDFLNRNVINNDIVDVKETFSKFTIDVISSTVFGVNSHCFENENAEFRIVAKKIIDWTDMLQSFSMRCYFLAPTLVNLLRLKFLNVSASQFLKKTFWKIMEEREASKTTRNDLIDILIQMKNSGNEIFLDEDKVVAQAIQFFVAGFETSSSTISFALYELARNLDVQERLRAEINSAIHKHGNLSYDTLKEMPYLDMVIKETLRKYPILPFLDRRCKENYKIPKSENVVIEKGVPIFMSVLGLHYDPLYFPDPNKFDPERFSPENIPNIQSFTYLPFGEGPRNCIGARFGLLNTKLAVAITLQQFHINICDETQKYIKYDPRSILITPIEGYIKLRFTKN